MKLLLNKTVTGVVAGAALVLAATLAARSASAAEDAANPKAAVPPLVYRSAFQGYRPNAETELGKWREANDKVGRIGGWRAYAKEAAAPEQAASAAAMEHKP